MARFLLKPGLALLRILIIAGAVVSVAQPHVQYQITQAALVHFQDSTTHILSPESGSLVRLAFTAISLSLL